MKKYLATALLSLAGLTALPLASLSQADYSTHPEAAEFIDLMVEKHEFARDDIVSWLSVAKHQESIVKAMSRPAEKVKPWYEYRKHFISDRRINGGVKFWQEHKKTLEQAERDFGVDPAIIVSIIGVETNYGSNTGSYKVVDALATLAFDYYTYTDKRESRKRFFTSELENLFLLSREQNQNPIELTGSYAGAMGWGQFMPSSYRAYAVDFDDDQFADIWNNPTDAIGSVASYFSAHHWRQGETVAVRANISTDPAEDTLNKLHRPKLSLTELGAQGYNVIEQLPPETKALPMRFSAKYGNEYWLGMHNFYVISRYNPRTKYAMAVYQLSELIRQEMCAVTDACSQL
ncbi:Membrane-bound lytic murein transglycosylase B precursor [Gammaproteobacteria bacterium MOLA455]|nr:Membrane-bound lytic murein transglycosylase B precursor [Gammaproteobacteria bacterium MOLA455]